MNKIVRLIAIFLLLLCLLCACGEDPTEPSVHPSTSTTAVIPPTVPNISDDPSLEILNFYLEYLEASKISAVDAILKYLYFENEEYRLLSLSSAEHDNFLSYQMIRLEKLSDDLWLIESFIQSEKIPGGIYGLNFVGRIDGKLYVMSNKREIPEYLKNGLEIEDYEPHGPGGVAPDDVLGPVG